MLNEIFCQFLNYRVAVCWLHTSSICSNQECFFRLNYTHPRVCSLSPIQRPTSLTSQKYEALIGYMNACLFDSGVISNYASHKLSNLLCRHL